MLRSRIFIVCRTSSFIKELDSAGKVLLCLIACASMQQVALCVVAFKEKKTFVTYYLLVLLVALHPIIQLYLSCIRNVLRSDNKSKEIFIKTIHRIKRKQKLHDARYKYIFRFYLQRESRMECSEKSSV